MQITFLGATKTVTGSKYLLAIAGKKILVDCGLFQGLKELRLRNWAELPINPAAIDAVVLTHAHIDHCGYLPLLVKNGFKGPIYCTPATKDLCEILLPDSGYLQEEEAAFANKHKFSKHHPALPLYTQKDAEAVFPQFKTINFKQPTSLFNGCEVTFFHAGHIMGASSVRISDGHTSILFSGDLGRPHDPVMNPPDKIETTDYLVLESTYGNRLHSKDPPEEELANVINTTVKRGGSILIPAFAVGRAQVLLYYIAHLKEQKKIPDIPVYLDSPMAIDATQIFYNYPQEHHLSQEECKKMHKAAIYINSVEESKQIDTITTPIIIISASGMLTGGRVLHHLKIFGVDERNTILFVGYQAAGTRGEALLNGKRDIKLFGELHTIRAEIAELTASAHADSADVLDWLKNFRQAPRKVFITHGEVKSATALKEKIEAKFGWHCMVPEYLYTEKL